MKLPETVELIEVCPRDGFQNVHDLIPFDAKVAIIKKLAEAGFRPPFARGALAQLAAQVEPLIRRQNI